MESMRARFEGVFWETMEEFCAFHRTAFPECAASKDWELWRINCVGEDVGRRRKALGTWADTMHSPLVKGCAKYAKAIQSLTGEPACVFHAVHYADAHALHESVPMLAELDLPTKVASLSAEQRGNMWKMLQNLYKVSCLATEHEIASVPTPEQIAADIARRKEAKEAKESTGGAHGTVEANVREAVSKLLSLRGHEAGVEAAASTLLALDREVVGELEAAAAATPPDAARLAAACVQLGEEPYDDAQAGVLRNCLQMLSMRSTIPPTMMRGIEDVASSIMRDMQSGTMDLSSLDMDAIGRRVLSGVSPDDIADFSNQIDKLMPMLSANLPGGIPFPK